MFDAGPDRIEQSTSVLETEILPLNYGPILIGIVATKYIWNLTHSLSINGKLSTPLRLTNIQIPINYFVGKVGFEPTWNQLLFQLLIRERRYNPMRIVILQDDLLSLPT